MNDDRVQAPFTPDQVRRITEWQANDQRHPLTCCDHQTMDVTPNELVCPKCGREQDWVPSCVVADWPDGLSDTQNVDFADPLTSLEMICAAGYHRMSGANGLVWYERRRLDGPLDSVAVPRWVRQLDDQSYVEGMKEARRLMKAAIGIEGKS